MKQTILNIITMMIAFIIMGCNLWCVIYGAHHIMNMIAFFVLIPVAIISTVDVIENRK